MSKDAYTNQPGVVFGMSRCYIPHCFHR
jgi:hypothetical protein